MKPWIACESTELAVECQALAQRLGLLLETEVHSQPVAACTQRSAETLIAFIGWSPPNVKTLLQLKKHLQSSQQTCLGALLGHSKETLQTRSLSMDLGIAVLEDIAPLLAAIALANNRLVSPVVSPGHISLRLLQEADRVRLGPTLPSAEKASGFLSRVDPEWLGWSLQRQETSLSLGSPRDVRLAMLTLERAERLPAEPGHPQALDVDADAAREVLFGPPRALSDPASKRVLSAYRVPVPSEELCSSPTRASAEAARLGFPVRITLASPDLRVWDHPELSVDRVDNAAQVRDVFREITTLAQLWAPSARILGVTVSASIPASALLRIYLEPIEGHAERLLHVEFADAHGRACQDGVQTLLPASYAHLERALHRLLGVELLYETPAGQRRPTLAPLIQVLLQLSQLAQDRAKEVSAIQIEPLALLVNGGLEAREACISINDAFVQTLSP